MCFGLDSTLAPSILAALALVVGPLAIVAGTGRDWRVALDRLAGWASIVALAALLGLIGFAVIDAMPL